MYGFIDAESNLDKEELFSKLNIEIDLDSNRDIGFYLFSDNIVSIDNLIISFDGVIYNLDSLNKLLNDTIESSEDEKIEEIKSKFIENPKSSQLVANLIYYYYKITDNLLVSVNTTISILDGDYSFIVFDGENLAICRDEMGVKPIFCAYNNDTKLKAFASNQLTLWKLGFDDKDIYDLKPGNILYNWSLYENKESILNKLLELDLIDYNEKYDDYNDYLKTKESYEIYKDLLFANLIESVYQRVKDLDKVALIFSGGVDSSILAIILKEIANQRMSEGNPLDFKLFSVGLANSQDINASVKIANDLDLELEEIIIDEEIIRRYVEDVLIAIEDANIMKLGVGMTMFIASKFIAEEGYKVALSGQGADELFGGYNRYLKHFENNNLSDAYFALDNEIRHDIENMYHVNLERDYACTIANDIELRVPFLDKKLVKLAIDCPANFKIKDSEDILRKDILRDVAREFDLPDYICDRPKKAAQYGSGINKILKKKVLKGFGIEDFIESLKNE